MPWSTGKQLRELRREVRVLVDQQHRTNALLAAILASQDVKRRDRDSQADLVKMNSHLSHGAVMLAAVSVAVGIIALLSGLPPSRFTLIAIVCAGAATLVLLIVAAVQLAQGWELARGKKPPNGER